MATVSPALYDKNGKLTTDYKTIEGSDGCLANNYTLLFLADGTYQFSSTGKLCTTIQNKSIRKWKRAGADVILTGLGNDVICKINGNTLTYELANTPRIVYWLVSYKFKAK